MSCLLFTGLSVQVQEFGLSSTFLPPLKLLSEPAPNWSIKWKVVAPFTGVPFLFITKPPLPDGFSVGIQSPMPLGVGVFASRLPSIPNPPAGTLTGAVPPGGGGQTVAA